VSDDQGQPAVVDNSAVAAATLRSSLAVPSMIAEAGAARASRRFLDFFAASIENDNTGLAYYRACSFFGWVEQHSIGELPDAEPFHVAAYLKALRVSDAGDRTVKERTAARPTGKQHWLRFRMLFDWLVIGQVLAINAAHAVRGPKHVIKRGKTPVLSEEQARRLLASIKITKRIRATGITAYLEAAARSRTRQAMAAHESPHATKLYDRTGDEITLDEVERIQI
jgi:integrase